MIRALYRCLIRMHPPAFRREFGAEMIWIFDQAAGTPGGAPLLADAVRSLARQWLLRSGSWKVAVALSLALLQLSIGMAGMLLVLPRRVARLAVGPSNAAWARMAGFPGDPHQPVTLGVLLCLTVTVVGGLVLFLIVLTNWLKNFSTQRRRMAPRGQPCSHFVR